MGWDKLVGTDDLSKRHNSLTQKNQEVLDNLRNKYKTEETNLVTKILAFIVKRCIAGLSQ